MSRPADRCPGVFATHAAADGQLARLRLSGGRISAAQLEALAQAAEDLGDGHLELTGRANVQVRGIDPDDVAAFADRVVAAGLAAGHTHDRVRNIAVSPFAGRLTGGAQMWAVADRLGELLLESPRAQELSGRFWFGLDDGSGDVLARTPDLAGHWIGDGRAGLRIGGTGADSTVAIDDLAEVLLSLAHRFLELRTDQWRIGELSAGRRALLDEHASGLVLPIEPSSRGQIEPVAAPVSPRVGWFGQHDGRVLLGAVVPFGRLSAQQAQFAAAIGAPLIVTPDRELLIADLSESVAETVVRVLAPRGFVFDASSPWTRASACTGSPGCGKSRGDVRGLLAGHLDAGGEITGREHWVGCERGCGAPPDARVRLLGGHPPGPDAAPPVG